MRSLILLFTLVTLESNAQFRQLAFDNSDQPQAITFETGAALSWSVLSGAWTPGMEMSFGFINRRNMTAGFRLGFKGVEEKIENHGPASDASIRQIHSVVYGGYIFNPERMWHFRANLGLGALWEDQKNYSESNIIVGRKVDTYFLVEPRVGLEVNVNRWMCLDIWIGHSFTAPIMARNTYQKGSPQLLIGIQVGRF